MTRRLIAVAVAVAACVAYGVGTAQQMSADDIIAKNLAARGGVERFKSVRTIKQIGRLKSQGVEVVVTIYTKRPNLVRQEITFGELKQIIAFDGKTAWGLNPMRNITTPTPFTGMEAEQAKEQSEFDGPFIDYKARGTQVELAGTETTGGRTLHHLKVTLANKRVVHFYVDGSTWLEAKFAPDNPGGVISEQVMSDYRDVDGLKMPFKISTVVNGQTQVELIVDTIELNPVIDDAIFVMKK